MSEIQFPAVCFTTTTAWFARERPDITTTTRRGLRKDRYSDLLVVDSRAMAFRFDGAVEVGRAPRPAWAPRLTFNWIEVELRPVGPPERIETEALRKRVLRSFDEWHGWSSAGDFEETEQAVVEASSSEGIMRALTKWSAGDVK